MPSIKLHHPTTNHQSISNDNDEPPPQRPNSLLVELRPNRTDTTQASSDGQLNQPNSACIPQTNPNITKPRTRTTCRRRIQEAELKRWTTRNGRRWTDEKKEVYWKYTTQPTMTTAQPTSSDSSTPGTTTPALPMPSRNPLPLSASQEAQVRDLYYARVRNKCRAEIKGSYLPTNQPLCSPTRACPLTPIPSPHQPSPTALSYTPSPPPSFAKNPSTS